MPVKSKPKKRARKKAPSASKALKIKWELFCQFYVVNSQTRGIATLCYGEAFDYKLDTLRKDDAVYSTGTVDDDGVYHEGELIQPSTYDRAYAVCAVEANRLLKNPKIQDRITELRNELLRDTIVDGELAKVILQDHELPAKMAGIREYNSLRNRVKREMEVKHTLIV